MRRCARCGEEKPTSEFGWKDKEKGWLMSYCKPCVRANSKRHYQENRPAYLEKNKRRKARVRDERWNFLLWYFSEHPCVDCGETDPDVLEFDHLRDKEFCIGHEMYTRPWAEVFAEIQKCDVVCANCHRRRTARRGGHLRLVLMELR